MKQFVCTFPVYPIKVLIAHLQNEQKVWQVVFFLFFIFLVCFDLRKGSFKMWNKAYFPNGNGIRWPSIFLIICCNMKPFYNYESSSFLCRCSSPGRISNKILWFCESTIESATFLCKTVPGLTSAIYTGIWERCLYSEYADTLFVKTNDLVGNICMHTRAQVFETICSLLLPSMGT